MGDTLAAQGELRAEADRETLVRTIGNLALLPKGIDVKLSHDPSLGDDGKRQGPEACDVLILNRKLLNTAGHEWSTSARRAVSLNNARSDLHSRPVRIFAKPRMRNAANGAKWLRWNLRRHSASTQLGHWLRAIHCFSRRNRGK
jgi:hypothetical protein